MQPMTAAKNGAPRAEKQAASRRLPVTVPSLGTISSHLDRCKWARPHCSGPGQRMMTQSNRDGTLYLDLNIANYNLLLHYLLT